nr:hypothetical protein [Tanacetum cinerariifolium]
MDLFSLIRAPNPTKVKTESRPSAPNELPLLTLTAPRAEASGRETAALEMPSPEEVPITTAPGAGQAAKAVVARRGPTDGANLLIQRDPAQRRKTPLVLPWERIPRLDSGVRIRICYGE